MSLEQVIAENNSLLRELIDLQKSGGAAKSETSTSTAGAKGGKATSTKAKATSTKAKAEIVDPDTLKAKLVEYKNATDLKAAKALTKKLGYDAIADVPEEDSKRVFDAIDEAILALDNGNSADGEAEDDL